MFPQLTSIIQSTNNLTLQITLALCLTLILYFFKIPEIFLYGLLTYVHPDDAAPQNTSSGGLKAAIRRPGTYDSGSELKQRKKSKDKFEFDEQKAQIFRIKLNDNHLRTRVYFKEFSSGFDSAIVALSSLLLHRFLSVSQDSGILKNGSVVPILLGLVCIGRMFVLIAKVSSEKSASKRSEKQLSVLLGVLGFFLGLTIVFDIIPRWVFDFKFESLDGYGKFSIALLMGCISGFLYMPAIRNARAFWIGTDQIRCSLPIISCGWFARMILYVNYVSILFTSLLWFSPFSELLINKNINRTKSSNSISNGRTVLVGHLGISQSDFEKFRLWCLLISGILQFIALRANVQMFLNEAVLCWYQRLHGSKVPDLDYSRAKVFLHNHYLSLVVLQFFVPSALVLLFLALSQTKENLLTDFQSMCHLLPCSALVKEVALYMAWWILFMYAIFTSAILALYRRGILYIS